MECPEPRLTTGDVPPVPDDSALPEADRPFAQRLREWSARCGQAPEPEGRPTETLSGLPVRVLYTHLDLAGFDPEKELGAPGAFPFTRGVYDTMYQGRLWTMRQFAGFGTARDTNARYRYLLEKGQTGLSVAFDMPTLMGLDADHPRSLGEVGREGVAVCSLQNMQTLFDGIRLDQVSTSMTINSPAAVLLAFYVVAAERQGVPPEKLRGTTQNDILKEYQAQKEYIFPPEPSVRLVVDTFAFCADHMPLWHPISVSGYHIREAGSTAVQELAFTLANGFAYVEAAMAAGLDVDGFAPRLSFFFNSHIDFFEEIAKYRAARRIYAKRMRDRYGAKRPRSWLLRFHTQTAGCSLTAQQPENNIVRTAYQGLAAVLGGTQSLHTNSFDEALALPTEHAVTIALRTQQILAYETGIPGAIDPLGGSYFVEDLTRRMEEEAEAIFAEIDARGGVVAAIEEGYFQREIARSAYEYQRALETQRRIIVGVNRFVEEETAHVEILRIDPEVERTQVLELAEMRSGRDGVALRARLQDLQAAVRAGKNLMPPIVEAVRIEATLGEIMGVLRAEYGEWHEPTTYW